MSKPWVTINCAMSLDGKIALPSRRQTRISCEEDLKRVHKLRNDSDAIVVGIGTVLMDDPKLLVKEKYISSPSQPLRIILDSNLRIPRNAQVLKPGAPTLIVTTCKEDRYEHITIIRCGPPNKRVNLHQLIEYLGDRGIKKIMVEGGETVIWEFLRNNLVDELLVFIAPMIIGGVTSPTLAGDTGAATLESVIHMRIQRIEKLEDGLLIQCKPQRKNSVNGSLPAQKNL